MFRFAHPREVRRFAPLGVGRPYTISIRAPATGAPITRDLRFVLGRISIRAPAQGATVVSPLRFLAQGISIRAPAKGATPEKYGVNMSLEGFDSRTRVGCDIWIAKIIAFATFRFAHPHKVR